MSATQYSKLFLFAVVIFVTQAGVWGQTPVSSLPKLTYTNGTTTFTVPQGVYSLTLEAWGGGGGGSYSNSAGAAGGGGGGGAYAKSIVSVTPGQTLTLTVGTGGAGSSGTNSGNPSSVSLSGTELVKAAGGSGAANGSTNGGAGGQASACFSNIAVAYSGGKGGNGGGNGCGPEAGGGGAAAGSTGSGKNGNNGSSDGNVGGSGGGSTADYGGAGGKGAGSDGTGDPGENYGGGGGGGKRGCAILIGGNKNGGNGASGLVRISFTSSPSVSLAGTTTVCPGDPALTATSPHPVRSSSGWEWIKNEENSGTYSNSPTFTTENLSPGSYTYKVRAHYTNIIWNGITYPWLYDDSQNTATFTVTSPPVISEKTVPACSGELFSITPSNTLPDVVPTGTTYSWAAPALPEGVTATGATTGTNAYNISGTLINTTTTPQTVTYVVTPKTGNCGGVPFNIIVKVNPKPVIPNSGTTICSGENVDYTPTLGTIPSGTTYTWSLSSVYPAGAIVNPSAGGSGSSINVGTLTNTASTNATVIYNVTPTAQGCPGASFTFTVIVNIVPQIIASKTTICSGDTLHLRLDKPIGGTYSSSNQNIAYIDADGILYTDVDIVGGIPTPRASHSADEGKGGAVTITYTTVNSCVTTQNIIVNPRAKTPRIRWNYAGVCPMNEDDDDASYSSADSLNVTTPWNPDGIYMVNHIVWDSLVINSGYGDIELEHIKWYADAARTKYIRSGLDPLPDDGRMANFWQNEPHPLEEYWAAIDTPDSCESRLIRVEVHIYENPEQIKITNLVGYVQPTGTPPLDLSDYLDLGLDESQYLEWYASKQHADSLDHEIPEPQLNPTQPTDITYWLVKSDDYGCRSLPTPFRIQLLPMPVISIEPDTLVCPGEPVTVQIKISKGTAPYNFKRTNANSGVSYTETDYPDSTYTFLANPLSTVAHRITEFSDSITPLVTYAPYGLRTPVTGYFAETILSVVVTEITGISPNSGPTTGGVYTANPDNPINTSGTVTLNGRGFKPFGNPAVSLVTFGGIPATNITVIDNNTLTCTPPSHVSGDVTVAVTAACATVTLTDGYHYEPINIIGVQPAYGPVTGGTSVTIRGTGLLAIQGSENLVTVIIAGVPAQIVSVSNTEIQCITGQSNYSLLDKIIINNGSETREFAKSFTYYPVKFIENGNWSEPHRWETQTADHILPYPNASVQIQANCIQDIDVNMDSITIYPSKAYTLNEGIVLSANVFTLKDNASFLNHNTNSANMQAVQQNVEHLLTKGRNWYVSSPVQANTIKPEIYPALGKDVLGNDLDAIAGNIWRIECYNEALHAWAGEGKNSSFATGLGYTAYSSETDIAVKFSGTYTDGDQETPFNLTRQNDGHSKRGFNLVGNPFPSYWRWTQETAQQARLYSTIWYRTQAAGVYEFWSYNASGNVTVAPSWESTTSSGSYSLGYIPPMQAFWVRMLDEQSSGILTFSNNLRSHSDHGSNVLKSIRASNAETRPLLRIAVTNSLNADETVIYADPDAKKDFDAYDSDKWFINQGVEIFTLPVSSTRELVINGLPEIVNGTEIPLGFQANEGGTFSLRAKEILNLDTLDVYLSDKWRNIEFNLRNGDYTFVSSSIPATDRFSIAFRRSAEGGSSEAETGDDNLLVYPTKNGEMILILHLQDRQGSNANVSIFDITGRKLAEKSVVVGEQTTFRNVFPEGIYVLRAEKCTTKIMIKK